MVAEASRTLKLGGRLFSASRDMQHSLSIVFSGVQVASQRNICTQEEGIKVKPEKYVLQFSGLTVPVGHQRVGVLMNLVA